MPTPNRSDPSQSTLAKVYPRRTLILLGLGALIGLAIAGFGLFTAKGTTTRNVPPEDIALVNGTPILVVDYLSQLETLYAVNYAQATPEQRRKVFADMIREELYVQRGVELDMASVDPGVRSALVAAVEQQVLADVTTEVPSEASLQTFYAQHKDQFATEGTLLAQDLKLVVNGAAIQPDQQMAKAQLAVKALRSGAAVAQLARQYGFIDSGKLHGEEFYFAAQIHLGDELFAVAKGLPSGAVSEPVRGGDEIHILVVSRNVPPEPQSFSEARERVLKEYQREASERVQKADDEFLRKRATILIAPEYQQ